MLTLSQGGVVITKGPAPLARTTFPPYGQFASRSGAGLPVAENLCDALAIEVPNWADGATAWCASARTGAWASAAGSDVTSWSEVGTPTYTTVPVVPSGQNGSTRVDLQLNGTSQRVDSSSVASPTGDVTVCALVMPMENPATQYGVLVGRDGAARVLILDYTSGAYRIQPFYQGVGAGTAVSGGTAQEGALSLVCGVYDYVTSGTSSLRLYVDGASVGSPVTTAAGPLVVSSQPYSIGFEGTFSTYAATSMGGALVVEQALSAAQIAAIARRVLADQPRGVVQGSSSMSLTYSRTGSMFCAKTDNTGTMLPPNRPCVAQSGLLIEGAATNLILRSQEFGDGTSWVVAGGTVTQNYALAPDGTKTAERYVWGANNYVIQTNNTGGLSTARSVFLKGTSGSGSISIGVGGSAGQCKACPFTATAWSRCEYSLSSANQSNFFIGPEPSTGCSGVGDASGDVIVWGLQSEIGTLVATSYIPTTSAAASRGAVISYINTGITNPYPISIAASYTFWNGTNLAAGKHVLSWYRSAGSRDALTIDTGAGNTICLERGGGGCNNPIAYGVPTPTARLVWRVNAANNNSTHCVDTGTGATCSAAVATGLSQTSGTPMLLAPHFYGFTQAPGSFYWSDVCIDPVPLRCGF